jgi:hypothetical protein
VRYAVRTSACEECPLKSKCTNSPKGRWVSRSLEEEYLDRVMAYRETEAYRKALLKRAVWEGLSAATVVNLALKHLTACGRFAECGELDLRVFLLPSAEWGLP